MTTVQIDLPDALAQQARSAGLLSPQKMEAILRAQLRRESFAHLREMHNRLPNDELTLQNEQEIADAVREVRTGRRPGNAG